MLRLRILCAAVAAAVPFASVADDAALDRVVVSASTSRMPDSDAALPNTITVITREDLDQQLAITTDLSQILANLVPAFAPSRQKMTSFGESLRGRQPLYLVDGIPQSTPLRDGSRDAHTIDPALIERIEVIHGANALQGLGASGGIINIITKKAPAEGDFHEVTIGGSTAVPTESDSTGWRTSYVYGVRGDALDFLGGATYASNGLHYDADGRALGVNNVQGDLMDSDAWNLYAKLGFVPAEGQRLQLTANRYSLDGNANYVPVPGDFRAGRPATSRRGDPLGQPAANDIEALSLDYTHDALLGGTFVSQLFWQTFEARFGGSFWGDFFRNDPTANWFDQSQNESEKLGGKFSWSKRDVAGIPLNLTLGLDLNRDTTFQKLLVSDLNWVPETIYESVSPFVQAEWWINDRWMLAGGVRHERGTLEVDDYYTLPTYGTRFVEGGSPETRETLPNLGLVWHVTDTFNVYASYAEGYTVADIGRILRAINVNGQSVERLVDLTPVVADNREVGMDYDDGRWTAHAAAYWSESDFGSLLVYDASTDTYNVSRQATEIDGIEANVGFRFSEAGRVGIGYAAADGRYDRNGDGDVDTDLEGINIAPDRATAFWEQTWTDAFATRLQASTSRDRSFDRLGTQIASFDGYTTVDLYARIGLPVGSLNLGLENLLDEQYVTYFSQTTPSNDDYVAGRGRVFSATWSHRF